jgi:uncharacterized membrane protein
MSIAPFVVASAWLLFAGSHVLFGFPPLRQRLAQRLGEQRFVAAFCAVAALTLAALAVAVARFGDQGPAGLALGAHPAARLVLASLAVLGLWMAMAALPGYGRSPMALFRTRFPPPAGFAKISRHGFFVGMALFAVAHAALAPTLAQAIHIGGYAALALIGARWQDRKLLGRHGQAYADYMASTSVLPLLALLQGRQRLAPEDRLPRVLLRAAVVTAALLVAHPLWSLWNGAAFSGLLAVGGVAISLRRALAPPAGQRESTRAVSAARDPRGGGIGASVGPD